MKLLSKLSIKKQITASVFLAVFASTTILEFVAVGSTRDLLETRLETKEFPNLVQRARNSIEGEIKEMRVITHAIATNPMIIGWSEQGADSAGEAKLVDYLAEMASVNGLSNASFVDRETNNYWNQDGFLRTLQNDAADGWFFAYKRSGQARSASTYTNPDGSIDVFVNYQQLNGRGASGVSKSFDEVIQTLSQFKIEDSGFLYLIDSQGLAKVHRDASLVDSTNLADMFPDIDTAPLLKKGDFSFASNQNTIIATSYVESLDWYVVAQVPRSELYAALDASRNFMILILLVSLVVFVAISVLLANRLVAPIEKMATVFEELGQGGGDLSFRLSTDEADEISRLAKGFNAFVEKIREVVVEVSTTSNNVLSAANDTHDQAQNFRLIADQQRDESFQVSTAMNEMGSTIADIAKNANEAASASAESNALVQQVATKVEESSEIVGALNTEMESVSTSITSLADRSRSITSVLEVIQGVSEQTNLLALNAAIEAARAGEHGRGFAVVADEVRSLAQRTSVSADEISQIIHELQTGADASVDAVDKSKTQVARNVEASEEIKKALESILSNIQSLSDINTQVATATEEQNAVVNEINERVMAISDTTDQNGEAASNLSTSSDALKSMSTDLADLVKRFRI